MRITTSKLFSAGILAYIRTALRNGSTEGLNNKTRLITRRACGFHSAHALIEVIFLCCGAITFSPRLRHPQEVHEVPFSYRPPEVISSRRR